MKWGSIWSSIFDFHSVDLDEFELDVDLELNFIGFSPRDGGALAVYKSLFIVVITEIPGIFWAGKFKCCDQYALAVTR